MTPPQLRFLRILALAGCSIGFPFSILLGAAYLATPDGSDQPPVFPWDDALREAIPAAFDFAGPPGVYLAYGAITPLVVAGIMAGVWLLHRLQRAAEPRWARAAMYAFIALQGLFGITIMVAFYFDPAFFVALPALLLSLIAASAYGVATIRMKTVPAGLAWLTLVSPLYQMPASIFLGHNSIGLWGFFIVGIWAAGLQRRDADSADRIAEQPTPV